MTIVREMLLVWTKTILFNENLRYCLEYHSIILRMNIDIK